MSTSVNVFWNIVRKQCNNKLNNQSIISKIKMHNCFFILEIIPHLNNKKSQLEIYSIFEKLKRSLTIFNEMYQDTTILNINSEINIFFR